MPSLMNQQPFLGERSYEHSCSVADPGKRKGGFQTIEREARGVKSAKMWGNAHFRCSKTRENPILSSGKSHLRLRGTAANSQLASLG